nr:hypothetical protein [Tanacetum cinerariifolium]
GNPLYLHANDSNCASICFVKLIGVDNYRIWASAMKLALEIKHKMGFITGSGLDLHGSGNDRGIPFSSGTVKTEKGQASAFVSKQSDMNTSRNNNWSNNVNRGVYDSLLKGSSNNSETKTSGNVSFTNEQVMKLMSLLNDKGSSASQSNMAGANQNMTNSIKDMVNLVDVSDLKLTVGHPNETPAKITHVGNLKLNNDVMLFDVLVIPEYTGLKKGRVPGTGSEFGGLYLFDKEYNNSTVANNSSLNLSNIDHEVPYEVCHKAKQTMDSFSLSANKSTVFGQLMHLGVWGPYKVISREWFRCFLTIVDDYSRLPSSVLNGKSLFSLVYNKEPNLSYLRSFGCLCYAALIKGSDKFSKKSKKCVLIGYVSDKKAYKLFSLKNRNILYSRDVKFYETIFPYKMSVQLDVEQDETESEVTNLNFFDCAESDPKLKACISPNDDKEGSSCRDGSVHQSGPSHSLDQPKVDEQIPTSSL